MEFVEFVQLVWFVVGLAWAARCSSEGGWAWTPRGAGPPVG